jgi:hypothetical protein
MAESRLTTIYEFTKPPLVRVALAGLAAVSGYDALSSQLDLPTIRKIWGVSGSLLPWWGWLLILQAVLGYALFEYVRLYVSRDAEPLSASSSPSTAKVRDLESRLTKAQDRIAQLFDRADKAEADMAGQLTSLADGERVRYLLLETTLAEKAGQIAAETAAREQALLIRLNQEYAQLWTAISDIEKLKKVVSALRILQGAQGHMIRLISLRRHPPHDDIDGVWHQAKSEIERWLMFSTATLRWLGAEQESITALRSPSTFTAPNQELIPDQYRDDYRMSFLLVSRVQEMLKHFATNDMSLMPDDQQ